MARLGQAQFRQGQLRQGQFGQGRSRQGQLDPGQLRQAQLRQAQFRQIGAAASFADFLAVVSIAGGISAGVLLLQHHVRSCTSSAVCAATRHPFMLAGIAAIIGGLLLGAICVIIGRLCVAVAALQCDADPPETL